MRDEHWQIATHGQYYLAMAGMVIGRVDSLIEAVPLFLKVLMVVAGFTLAYADLKNDMALINLRLQQHELDAIDFRGFMLKGDRCTMKDCQQIRRRMERLEDKLDELSRYEAREHSNRGNGNGAD